MASSSRTSRAGWVVAGLLLLSAVPVIAGGVRLTELAGGADVTPENERFFAAPVPVVLHIVSVTVYSLLGAFQFVPGLRRRRGGWHRAAGRILVPSGLTAALTGLWMSVFYELPPHDGALLLAFRLVFGSAMAVSILLGFAAVRRRDVAAHRAWMLRGYAIGLGAGTQVLTVAPSLAVLGDPEVWTSGRVTIHALLMGAGWVINLAVAEWAIRRRPPAPARRGAGPAAATA